MRVEDREHTYPFTLSARREGYVFTFEYPTGIENKPNSGGFHARMATIYVVGVDRAVPMETSMSRRDYKPNYSYVT